MKKILTLLFSIFLLVSCDALLTTSVVETNTSYWRYDPYNYRNYHWYNRQYYWDYPRQRVIIIKQYPQRKYYNFNNEERFRSRK